MTRRFALIVAAAAGKLLAQTGIAPPQAGFIRDDAGALRPVYGLAGNFVLGRPIAHGIISAAFSGRVGLAKTADALWAFDRQGRLIARASTAGGPAQFSFSAGGSEAVAFLTDTCDSFRWAGGRFQQDQAVCPEGVTPFLNLLDGTTLFAEGNDLVFRRADRGDTRTRLAGTVLGMEQMGEGWIHVRESGRGLTVRLAGDRIELFRLPEAAP